MPNTCSVVFCKSGNKKRRQEVEHYGKQPCIFLSFKKPDLLSRWTKFINRKDWMPGKNGGICSKHFEDKFLKPGKRTTLRWDLNPVPSIYPDSGNFPPSLLPSVPPRRKSPTREFPDQISKFRVSALGYQLLKLQKNKAIFYETENCPVNDIPLVTETIVVTDSLNVKLFWKAIPVPLPE